MAKLTPLEKLNKKYGVSNKKSSALEGTDKVKKTVSNYQTRLKSAGIEDTVEDTRNPLEKALNLEKDQNVLFDILELINRPQNALLTGINNVLSGESFGEGLKEGITGETKTSGKDILTDQLDMKDESGKLDLSDVLGFGIDVISDPLDWVIPGVGKSVSDIGLGVAKNATKKGVGLVDNVVTKGLEAADKLEASKIAKRATKEGFKTTEDFLTNIGLKATDIGGRAEGYKTMKEGLKDVFNQGATTLGKIKGSKRNAEGANELFEQIYRPYKEGLENSTYKYIRENSTNLANADLKNSLDALDSFLAKNSKNTYTDWIRKNPNDALALTLKNEQDTLASDILNVLQSNKNTSVRGKRAIENLIKNGEFTGDAESVQALTNLLNETAQRTGTVLNPKTNLIDDILQNSSISIENMDKSTLKEYLKNPQFNKELENLQLKYNLEYTPEEFKYINDLKNNQNFMNLVGEHENAYKTVANQLKDTTGLDYSDIVNRQGYLRKAQGTSSDIDNRIRDMENIISDDTVDEATKANAQNVLDALNERKNQITNYGTKNAFGSQKYEQPALVANRQYKEELQRKSENISKQIDELKNTGMTKKESLTNTLSDLKKVRENSDKLAKLNKRLEKGNTNIENIANKIISTEKTISDTSTRINDNIINKAKKIQDQSVTDNFAKQLTETNNLKKQINKITKQLTNSDSLDDNTVKSLTNSLTKAQEKLDKVAIELRKTTDIIDGHVDETIQKSLNINAKNIEKYTAESFKLDKLKEAKNRASENVLKTRESINSITNELDKAIKNTEFKLENIKDVTDTSVDEQIKALSKAKSILDDEASQTLFSTNFYAGLDDFVHYAEYTNETAQVFKDALTTGLFSDGSDILKTVKGKNDIRVSGKDIANRLNSIQTIISEGKISPELRTVIKSLEDKHYYMDPRVASLFGIATGGREKTNGLLNLVDKFNTTFKKWSTLTPGFHVRNYIGNTTNMYLSGMPVNDIAKYQAKATKLMNKSEDLLNKVAKNGVDSLVDEELKDWNLLKQFYKGGFGDAGTAVRDLEKVQKSIQLGKGNLINKVADKSINFNNKVDNMNRLALLMYATDDAAKGGKYLTKLGAENPIQAVKYALMDPSNMSETEQQVIKKIVPFYTFTKQNLMFQATNITKNIRKYKNLMRGINDAYKDLDEDSYYEYQKDNMQIPIPWAKDDEGNQLFLKANLPLSDLGEFLSNPAQKIAASLTPIIKAPIEMTTGKSLYTGEDTNYNVLKNKLNDLGVSSKGIQNTAQAAETILNNFGLQNVSTNLIRKVQAIIDGYNGDIAPQQVWAEIFRSVVQNANQENVETSKLYDEMEGYQQLFSELKKQGIDVPTIREINASNKNKLRNMKNKRTKSK